MTTGRINQNSDSATPGTDRTTLVRESCAWGPSQDPASHLLPPHYTGGYSRRPAVRDDDHALLLSRLGNLRAAGQPAASLAQGESASRLSPSNLSDPFLFHSCAAVAPRKVTQVQATDRLSGDGCTPAGSHYLWGTPRPSPRDATSCPIAAIRHS